MTQYISGEGFTVMQPPWTMENDEHIDYHHRRLAGEKVELDYTVLSVGVMTLALLLCVELFRHHMDHLAHGRPFFKTVLDGVYSECKLLPFWIF